MKETARSWPMILLMMFTVAMLGFTVLVIAVVVADAVRLPGIEAIGAAIVVVSLALVACSPFMRVSMSSGTLRVRGLIRTTTIPVASISGVALEEFITPQAGIMYLPVVRYRDAVGERRQIRLWMLARKSRFAVESTLAWLEDLVGRTGPSAGTRAGSLPDS